MIYSKLESLQNFISYRIEKLTSQSYTEEERQEPVLSEKCAHVRVAQTPPSTVNAVLLWNVVVHAGYLKDQVKKRM